jgi:hypothetical protein
MKALFISPTLGIKNIAKKQEKCFCEYHKGMLVTQVEADLPNDVHFIVVRDDFYRLSINGSPLVIVNPDYIEGRLIEAMSD